jgi:hypothetical protein
MRHKAVVEKGFRWTARIFILRVGLAGLRLRAKSATVCFRKLENAAPPDKGEPYSHLLFAYGIVPFAQ